MFEVAGNKKRVMSAFTGFVSVGGRLLRVREFESDAKDFDELRVIKESLHIDGSNPVNQNISSVIRVQSDREANGVCAMA